MYKHNESYWDGLLRHENEKGIDLRNLQLSIGDYIYFKEGEYEYEARVVGVNADKIVTIEHADENGKMQTRVFGGMSGKELNVVNVKPVALFVKGTE